MENVSKGHGVVSNLPCSITFLRCSSGSCSLLQTIMVSSKISPMWACRQHTSKCFTSKHKSHQMSFLNIPHMYIIRTILLFIKVSGSASVQRRVSRLNGFIYITSELQKLFMKFSSEAFSKCRRALQRLILDY